mmetsp:Transcript_35176/g.89043  ORF Transcript_35176/g.89043 Transcript_35176/m.89043 type:complete len:461 (-) Transcript_35176:229-1611(-)|eukprot:CAMPEP_0202859892 /NCGR_PEP_ID=MMETSP1391-20130828/1826_1 /ASSEMBLY_ACC=CAM_ASM_000867 /TAXON_ID=1034604 /ORGANISM="Chlamydomonas leiostraca, Strain SAG 11-49" /LENGTH=460 /DNA_ID=CAMNT_0049538993 /DNA_START=54 /DNA_END=1436 /DNA_ORIENTATION=-
MTQHACMALAKHGLQPCFRGLGRLLRPSYSRALTVRATAMAGVMPSWPHACASLSALRPPAQAGQSIDEVDTPALLLDLDAAERNCEKLLATVAPFPNIKLRPHAKAHKTPQIAHMQMRLLGDRAQGICCQKVSEAEAMAAGGITDILVSNEVIAPRKVARLVALAAAGVRVRVLYESAEGLQVLADEARKGGLGEGAAGEEGTSRARRLEVMVEVNVGQDRCGVDDPSRVLSLAKRALELEADTGGAIKFVGIQAYQGALQHVRTPSERLDKVSAAVARAAPVVAQLKAACVPFDTVTGGGSGSYAVEARLGVHNELQPGSFMFGDADYARNIQPDGTVGEWEQALWVLTQVMSVTKERKLAVVDAGLKAVALDSGPPILPKSQTGGVQMEFQSGGDEHGKLVWPQGTPINTHFPELGQLLKLQPGHCDPTFNMYDWVVAYRGSRVEAVWPIAGRGPGL